MCAGRGGVKPWNWSLETKKMRNYLCRLFQTLPYQPYLSRNKNFCSSAADCANTVISDRWWNGDLPWAVPLMLDSTVPSGSTAVSSSLIIKDINCQSPAKLGWKVLNSYINSLLLYNMHFLSVTNGSLGIKNAKRTLFAPTNTTSGSYNALKRLQRFYFHWFILRDCWIMDL